VNLKYKVEDIHTIPLSTVAERLDLAIQNKGSYYTAICPLHSDTRDSLAIYDNLKKPNTKGFWRCFACGVSGDSIQIVSDSLNLSFVESVNWIGDTFGLTEVKLTVEQKKKITLSTTVYGILKKANAWFVEYLYNKGDVLDYLFKERDLNHETLVAFEVGYVPKSFSKFKRHMYSFSFSNDSLVHTGLFKQKGTDITPIFYGRIMMPMKTPQGHISGYVGRCFGESDIKYLTKNSTVFDKGSYVYGIHENRNRKADTVLVVEGSIDVMRVHQETELSAVSMLGTNITEQKIRQVMKYLKPKRIVFALDGDKAGRKGIQKFIENVFNADNFRLNMATDFYVYEVPDGYDIDRLIQEDKSEFYSRLKDIKPVFDYFLDYKLKEYDLTDVPSRGRYISEALGFISVINNFSEEDYLQSLSDKTGVSKSDLTVKLSLIKLEVMYKDTEGYEKKLLRYLIGNPERRVVLEKEMGFEINDFLSEDGKSILIEDFDKISTKILYMSALDLVCPPFKDTVGFGQLLAINKLYKLQRDYNQLSIASKNVLSRKTNGHIDTISKKFTRILAEQMREQ